MVANPTHLKETLDIVYDQADSNDADYIYRSLFWLAFMGFEWSDVTMLRCGDVSFDDMTITYRRPESCLVVGAIPQEAAFDIRKACVLTDLQYSYKHSVRVIPRAEGDRLIRLVKPMDIETEEDSKRYLTRYVRPMINRAFSRAKTRLLETYGFVPKWCSVDMTYDLALRSGVFYRLYERERAGLEINFANIFQARFSQYGCGPDAGFRYMYQRNYKLWKETFT